MVFGNHNDGDVIVMEGIEARLYQSTFHLLIVI